MSSVQRFMDEALEAVRAGAQSSGPLLGAVVEGHLGVDPATVPVVRLDVPSHQFVNLDVAVEALLEAHGGGQLVGIGVGTSVIIRRSVTCWPAAGRGVPRSGR